LNNLGIATPCAEIMARGFLMLPPEVQTAICTFLSQSDLKNSRLVSRSWDAAAQRPLFHTITLRINLQSFERLQDIARHPRLRKHVRAIEYECNLLELLDDDGRQRNFEDWVTHKAVDGLGLGIKARYEFLMQFSVPQLEEYYFNYCRIFYGQEHILRRNNERDMLLGTFNSLPGLLSVHYYTKKYEWYKWWFCEDEDDLPEQELLSLSSLSSLEQEVLARPPGRKGYSGRHFWTLLHSACMSGNPGKIKNISASNLDLDCFNSSQLVGDCCDTFSGLHHLSLDFDDWGTGYNKAADFTRLTEMISHMNSLRSLQLSFDLLEDNNTDLNPRIESIIPNVIHARWVHLTRLSLRSFVTTEAYLRNFLLEHAGTLRSLELAWMRLEKPGPSGPLKKGGSWISIIQLLSESLSLDEMTFHGELSNGWDEAFMVGPIDDEYAEEPAEPYNPDDCLKVRVERYITHGEECPFVPMKTGVNDDGLPWTYELDGSWDFWANLIPYKGNQST
jgi:hypothetical protein